MKTVKQCPITQLLTAFFLSALLSACGNTTPSANKEIHGTIEALEVVKGPHGGRLLNSGDFTLELAIFETGVPPEFRAWTSFKGEPLKPQDVDLNIKLTRLSSNDAGKVDLIKFKPHGDALRGDSVIYEPHSFVVNIEVAYAGSQHRWQYDNFEGRTTIETAIAKALEIETELAGPAVLRESINVFGKVSTNNERVRALTARFPGLIKNVKVSLGDQVRKGQVLATIESNESLNHYSIKAPISGVISLRRANSGEQTEGRALFVITDTSTVWVELSLFPKDVKRVKIGAEVSIILANELQPITGKISFIDVVARSNQSLTARLEIDNKAGLLVPGSMVKANINVAEHAVGLAVKRTGLQAFRDFTVVYAQVGEKYEVRMLELGREDGEWVEVLGGLQAGTRYVSKNSYILKADIEKSGASHDH